MLAEVYRVTEQTIEDRSEIDIGDRVALSRGEFQCMQQVLTQRLRGALQAQDAARLAAYRFKAKAAQHIDHTSANGQDVERVMRLIAEESLKMKGSFEENMRHRLDELQKRSEEEKTATQRDRIRMLRTNILGTVGVNRLARGTQMPAKQKAGLLNPPQKDARRRSVGECNVKRPPQRHVRRHEAQ